MKKKRTVWSCKYVQDVDNIQIVNDIAKQNNISEICASLLYNRGFKNAKEAHNFLFFEDLVSHSPMLLKDVEKAVYRIQKALENNERIVIYGDYDVDGVTSVTMLYL